MIGLNFIDLRGVSFEYKRDRPIINNLNLKIKKDEVTALLGPNGSGKTTLGKLMMGILKPTEGQVFISNKNISEMTLSQIGSQIGYLFQNPEKQFFANRVEDELGFLSRLKGLNEDYLENRIEGLLRLFQLEHVRKSSPLLLSQGEKQRLAIATILINDPKYLILDEPTTGLDGERKRLLVDLLEELVDKGIGMTIITHDHSFMEQLSQRVIRIHRGEVIYDQRI